MPKKSLFLVLALLSIELCGQVNSAVELPMMYNQRLNKIGFETTIEIDKLISDSIIYYRIIHWFRDKDQKVRRVINSKVPICKNDSVSELDSSVGLHNVKPKISGSFRIHGRYSQPHRFKKIGSSNYHELCGDIEVIIDNQTIQIRFSDIKMIDFGYLPIEIELFKPGTLELKRKYKMLKSEMGKNTAFMADSIKYWVENYEMIIENKINWREF